MRYPVLNFVSILMQIIGGLICIIAVIGAIGTFVMVTRNLHLNTSTLLTAAYTIGAGLATVLIGIGAIAAGQLIRLLIDIEHNTRMGR